VIDYNKIKNEIAKLKCPTHNQAPTKLKANTDSVEFSVCCEEFKKEVQAKIKDEMTKQGASYLKKTIGDAFKKGGFKNK
jgi:hypothetical protein